MFNNPPIEVSKIASIHPAPMFLFPNPNPLAPHEKHANIRLEMCICYAGIVQPDVVMDSVYPRQRSLLVGQSFLDWTKKCT
jgi:hypothetical protein